MYFVMFLELSSIVISGVRDSLVRDAHFKGSTYIILLLLGDPLFASLVLRDARQGRAIFGIFRFVISLEALDSLAVILSRLDNSV